MEGVEVISMDPAAAKTAYLNYRRRAKDEHRAEWKKQDQAIRRAYRQMAKGRSVIDLVGAFRATGLGDDGRPKLAIARADVPRVFVDVNNGGAAFHSLVPERARYRCPHIDVPRETWPGARWQTGEAQVPFIPPIFRPAEAELENYWILWEAIWHPEPPRDPMLLEPLGCNLWVVHAAWELTDVERAVMAAALHA